MAQKELSETALKNLWKTKKAESIEFEGTSKPIPEGEYTLGKFIATEGAIKNSDAVTFHYDLGKGLKLYTKHLNGTTIDKFNDAYTYSETKNKHYLIPKNRYNNVLISKMSDLSGKKVRISKDSDGIKVKFKPGGYETKEDARLAFEEGKADTIYKVEFL